MSNAQHKSDEFLDQITQVIEDNIANEQFGVSELADAVNMSRSNLLRKVKSAAKISVAQYIRQVRLKHGMEMLKQTSDTVSQISYKVGFGSTSYFIKCFKEYYGYSPGEVGKREKEEVELLTSNGNWPFRKFIIPLAAVLVIGIIVILITNNPFKTRDTTLEKSIAVLPFKNDSNDSSNVHIINGLMESTLNNLQKLDELRVISRTSAEKYRGSPKTIPELGKELNVNYFVEGSGQKIGDDILLSIQLIEAPSDKHLWSQQYKRKATDIFVLQQEIAKDIAKEVQVVITPEIEEQINKIPTINLVAYDYFLQAMEHFYAGTKEGLEEAIVYFKKATELDNQFARAYADMAISYYYLDLLLAQKQNTNLINEYADKALLIDPKLPQALIAKGLYYMNIGEYALALPPMEKALELNPNSALAINTLSDYYTNYVPNTRKYLQYALKGFAIDRIGNDSSLTSFSLLHIANAFIQTGFVEEAEKYIDQSLAYNSNNLFSEYVKAYILYVTHQDLEQLEDDLLTALRKDTTRIDILQEVAKSRYYQRDYEGAYELYRIFHDARITYGLEIYPGEDVKIATVFREMGYEAEAQSLMENYKVYAEQGQSLYRDLSMAMYYLYLGETEASKPYLEAFSKQEDYQYWILIFLEDDPLMDQLKNDPVFKEVVKTLEIKFWEAHEEIKRSLQSDGLI